MDTFTALASPTRREILELIAGSGQLAASDIYSEFSSTPPAISQHLRALQQARLVIVQKVGQKRLYSVDFMTLNTVQEWVQEINAIWGKRFDRLDQLLKNHTERNV